MQQRFIRGDDLIILRWASVQLSRPALTWREGKKKKKLHLAPAVWFLATVPMRIDGVSRCLG